MERTGLHPAINIESLAKSFGEIHAVDGIDLAIPKGEAYGLLGPNGAGKTTLMNIISTYIQADSGKAEVEGIDVNEHPQKVRKSLGIIPQEISLYDDLNARENIEFFGGLYGIEKNLVKGRTTHLLKLLGLDERAREPIKRFSGGMKRRLNIACSLTHEPPIILMDEPTVGIDPQSRNFIYEFIEELSRKGCTIVYTSHYMEEVERLCRHVAIIDHGKIIAKGTKDELIELVKGEDVVIVELGEMRDDVKTELLNRFAQFLPTDTDGSLRLTGQGIHRDVPSIIKDLMDRNITPRSVHILEPNLETVFLKLTGRELRD